MELWQPSLSGALIRIRPLTENDFDPLFLAASDPLIWEQHPERERYKQENFTRYFRSGIESQGGLAVLDQNTGQVIGSSRFRGHDPEKSSVEIGYTFLARSHWGNGHNRELKLLMLNHAFQYVDTVCFFVGDTNYRSQKAMVKIGATEVNRVTTRQLDGDLRTSVVYQIRKADSRYGE
ncbi:MAG: GNAT family N-acetyltransferase [Bdellovibrionota bacterium]